VPRWTWTRRQMIVDRGPADGLVLGRGGAQFVIGRMLEGEQGVVGIRQARRISSSLRCVARCWRACVCWMTNTMARVKAATRVRK
jgi:hypothetical protein